MTLILLFPKCLLLTNTVQSRLQSLWARDTTIWIILREKPFYIILDLEKHKTEEAEL